MTTVNPHRLVPGGSLGSLPLAVERVRAQVEAAVAGRALPVVKRSALGARAVPRSLARLVDERVFSPDAVDQACARRSASEH